MSKRSETVAAEECIALGAAERQLDAYPNREVKLGALAIARALPIRERRLVGPWCFLDRFEIDVSADFCTLRGAAARGREQLLRQSPTIRRGRTEQRHLILAAVSQLCLSWPLEPSRARRTNSSKRYEL